MTKDEFVTRLDALVSDPDNILQNAMSLRQDVCNDYDNFTQTSTAYETLKTNTEKLEKDLTDMKELNLKLFMSQPSVGNNASTDSKDDPEPIIDNDPTPDNTPTIDSLIGDIRKQLSDNGGK